MITNLRKIVKIHNRNQIIIDTVYDARRNNFSIRNNLANDSDFRELFLGNINASILSDNVISSVIESSNITSSSITAREVLDDIIEGLEVSSNGEGLEVLENNQVLRDRLIESSDYNSRLYSIEDNLLRLENILNINPNIEQADMNLLVSRISNLESNVVTNFLRSEINESNSNILYPEPRVLPNLFNANVSSDPASNMRHIMEFTNELILKNQERQSKIDSDAKKFIELENSEELIQENVHIDGILCDLNKLTEIDRMAYFYSFFGSYGTMFIVSSIGAVGIALGYRLLNSGYGHSSSSTSPEMHLNVSENNTIVNITSVSASESLAVESILDVASTRRNSTVVHSMLDEVDTTPGEILFTANFVTGLTSLLRRSIINIRGIKHLFVIKNKKK